MINGIGINFSGILLDEKLSENISVFDFSYKTSTSPKPLRIRFSKIDGFIMVLVSKKISITNDIKLNFGKIKIDS